MFTPNEFAELGDSARAVRDEARTRFEEWLASELLTVCADPRSFDIDHDPFLPKLRNGRVIESALPEPVAEWVRDLRESAAEDRRAQYEEQRHGC